MERESPGIVAVIPMKPLTDSKTRLAKHLSTEQRGDLVIGMLRRVIMALQSASVDGLWVVGGDRRVQNMTCNASGIWLEELGRNLNDTVAKAFDRVFAQGNSAMYLAGDLPFVKAGDVHSLLQASRRQNNISLAPARQDGGTNAIFVPAGIQFQPELGSRSFLKHLSQAARLGVSVAICYSPGLGFDLDTAADLETYENMEPGFLKRLIPGSSSNLSQGE
jgi:2-phospho-L-lactate guanylyltransferase